MFKGAISKNVAQNGYYTHIQNTAASRIRLPSAPLPSRLEVARAVGVSSVSNERGATMASDESYAVSSSFVLLTLVSMIEMNNVITRQFKVFEMSIPVKLWVSCSYA